MITDVDASMSLLEEFGVEGSLSLLSNIRDKLLGVREGPTGRSGAEEALRWVKLEHD
jgi:hypothetical protein